MKMKRTNKYHGSLLSDLCRNFDPKFNKSLIYTLIRSWLLMSDIVISPHVHLKREINYLFIDWIKV